MCIKAHHTVKLLTL